MDDQSVRIDVVVVAVGPADQPLAQLLREVRRGSGRLDLPLEVDTQGFAPERLVGRGREPAIFDHLREHRITPLQRAFRVQHRVVVAIALEHAGQRRAFQNVQLIGRFAEIGSRGHLDAIRVVEKRYRVQIGFENLVLAVGRLDLQRGDRFLHLARQRRRAADLVGIEVARELLRDRRAALPVAAKRVQRRRSGAPPVDAVMLIETMVLGRDQRVDHVRRDVLDSATHSRFDGLNSASSLPSAERICAG